MTNTLELNRKLALLLECTLFGLTLVGCGDIGRGNMQYAPDSYSSVSATGGSSFTLSNANESSYYRCPIIPNVKPVNSFSSSSNTPNQYRVCVSKTSSDPYSILVHGSTESSASVCMFPAVVDTNGVTRTITDPSSRIPVYSCVQPTGTGSDAGAYFKFTATQGVSSTFRAAIVVESNYIRMMLNCLDSQGYPTMYCPTYSLGTFR